VYSAFYGKVNDGEVAGHRSAIASDPDFRAHFNEIVDFTSVTDLELSESTLAAQDACWMSERESISPIRRCS